MLRSVVSAALLLSLTLVTSPLVAALPSVPPNILLVLVDDQGYYDLGCYGASELSTPHIDALAAAGLRFTDYYAAAPICSPSRAGLLTGCYPRRVGLATWVQRADSRFGIHPSELTLAELLQQHGYATACIGKWHLGFHEPFLPAAQGFDHYFGLLHNLDPVETVHFEAAGGVPLVRNGQVVQRPVDPATLTRQYTDEAIAFITEHRQQPFFVYLPHTMLHVPLGVSQPFRGSSQLGDYGDAVQELDFHMGRLVTALRELDIADRTLIIYASDNGRGPGRTADQPLRGNKLSTWEGGLRVPCIAWGPGVGIVQGRQCSEVVHAMDWYPTLATFAKVTVPQDRVLDGRDLSPLLQGVTDTIASAQDHPALNGKVPLRRPWAPALEWRELVTRDEYLNAYFYHGSQGALAAVRSGRWKLHLNPQLQLFDLQADPGEKHPVRNAQTIRKLRGMAVMFQEEMVTGTRPVGIAD